MQNAPRRAGRSGVTTDQEVTRSVTAADDTHTEGDWPARLAAQIEARQRRRDQQAAVRAELQRRRDRGKAHGHAQRLYRRGGERP